MINTKTALYPHQNRAFLKLKPLKVGAMFMEMGTGKTRTAIELVKSRDEKISKVIWCCPVSIKETIKQEILKHTNGGEIYLFDSKTTDLNIPKAFWYIVGIESIGGSDRVTLCLNKICDKNTMIIVDESSYIKGHRSKRTNRLTLMGERVRYRLLLTGTPISQGIVDLYAQMRFLSYKILNYRSFYTFANNHLVYDKRYKKRIVGTLNEEYIANKIKPYIYQVTKEECLDLPKKLYDTRYFTMSDEQRCLYDELKEDLLMAIVNDELNIGDIFTLFLNLQQVVCGFYKNKEFVHNRVNMLVNIIKELDEKVIIWAKFKKDINAIEKAISPYAKVAVFTGDTKQNLRQGLVDDFQNGDTKFFLSTPSAGGFGLTLTAASKVIFYNNSFKYAQRLQAEDRCHRIGQEKQVTYIDIICSDSIDGRIYNALSSKQNVVEAFKREIEKVKEMKIDEKDIPKYIRI